MPICQYCAVPYVESIAIKNPCKGGFIIARKCPNERCNKVIDHPREVGETEEQYNATNEKLTEELCEPYEWKKAAAKTASKSSEELQEKFNDFMEENSTLVHDLIEAGYKITFTIERP